jgi:iron(III) transport system permease protein
VRAAALAVAALTLVPLVSIIETCVSIGWDQASTLLLRPRVGELLSNTGRLLVGVVVACTVLGVGAAWLVERTDLPGRRIWNVLFVAPLAVPAFVNGYGWVSLTSKVEGLGGAVLVVSLSYFPLVYLPVSAILRGLDPAMEDGARSLGLGNWRTFTRVVLPQLRPAIAGGALLVTLHTFAEFGALSMLRFPTFTVAIYEQFQSTFNGPSANILAGVLIVACCLALTIELGARGRRRYARLGSGSPRDVSRRRLDRWTPAALVASAAVVVLSLGVPLASLVHWLAEGTSTSFPVADLVQATWTSARLGFLAALVAAVLAFPIAWLVVRRPGPLSTLTERVPYVGHSLPGIVVALALVTVAIRWVEPLYQTTTMLLGAYVILFIPLAIVSLRAALAQAPSTLEETARSLGARPLAVLRRVVLPLIAPGVGAALALVFLRVITELTATLLLAPIGTRTLSTEFWANADAIAYGAAAPYAALMVVLSMPAALLLTRQLRRSAA